jgi:hypothetical protein
MDERPLLEQAHETSRSLTTWANGAPRVAGNVMTEGAACIEVLADEIARLRAILRVVHLDWAIHKALAPGTVERVEAEVGAPSVKNG